LNFEVEELEEVKDGMYSCLERMVPDQKPQEDIHRHIPNFSQGRGTFAKQVVVHASEVDQPGKQFQSYIDQAFIVLVIKHFLPKLQTNFLNFLTFYLIYRSYMVGIIW
jgi:hypothetical protein